MKMLANSNGILWQIFSFYNYLKSGDEAKDAYLFM